MTHETINALIIAFFAVPFVIPATLMLSRIDWKVR